MQITVCAIGSLFISEFHSVRDRAMAMPSRVGVRIALKASFGSGESRSEAPNTSASMAPLECLMAVSSASAARNLAPGCVVESAATTEWSAIGNPQN